MTMSTMFGTYDPGVLLMIAGLAVAVAAVVLFGGIMVFGGQRQTNRRLNEIAQRWQPNASAPGAPTVRISQKDSSLPSVDKLLKQLLPRRDMLRRRLRKTGYGISVGQYVMSCVAVGAVSGLIQVFFFGVAAPVAILGAVASGLALPHMTVGWLGLRRQKKFTSQFPEAIDLIVRGLRSGLPVIESIMTVAQEMPKPVGEEFRTIADAVRFGQTLEDALWDAVPRIDTPEFKFFVVAIAVQRETGGNLAETLENLSDVLRKRRQMKKRIKAMASEPKASAWILGCLPFIMFAIIFFVNTGYVMTLFTDPRGPTLIGFGLLSQFIGIAIMAKMVRFEI
ncbi:MAG: type II secretion system F family protein [Alphaproteobacteria bacterium]|nr:type II secretion system F family protein [Alphaproteobacteria bacterium]